MGWGRFGRSKRAQSLGSAELEVAGNVLGSRLHSDDSVSTSQAWAPQGVLGSQHWAAGSSHHSQLGTPPFAYHR
jgi:hypothetical protein